MQPIVGRLVYTVIVTSYTQTHLTGNILTSLVNLNNYTDYWIFYNFVRFNATRKMTVLLSQAQWQWGEKDELWKLRDQCQVHNSRAISGFTSYIIS